MSASITVGQSLAGFREGGRKQSGANTVCNEQTGEFVLLVLLAVEEKRVEERVVCVRVYVWVEHVWV